MQTTTLSRTASAKVVRTLPSAAAASGVASHAAARDLNSNAQTATSTDLPARAQEAALLLKALANPDRLLLLCQLLAGERCVAELGTLSGINQPSLSQQLAVLRGERLVATRRAGKQVFYRVSSPAALAILHTLHGLFCAAPPAAGKAPAANPQARTQRHPLETP